MQPEQNGKFRLEDYYRPSEASLEIIGGLYDDFYNFRHKRENLSRFLQGRSLEEFLRVSRELFWNNLVTDMQEDEDLKKLGLDFSFPFIRKEVLDFTGRISSLGIKPQLYGDGLNTFGVKTLMAMYKKWRIKSVDNVEKFWDVLYGVMNGTVCKYVGYDNNETERTFLRAYNKKTGDYRFSKEKVRSWDDATSTLVPIEEMYFQKPWERNVQKQGKSIRKQEMMLSDFQAEYGSHPNSQFVVPGNQIAEDSLFFKLLGGAGILNTEKVQVLTRFDTESDNKIVIANGIPVNTLKGKSGHDIVMPNPFHHKSQPYVLAQFEPIDNNCYLGLSLPFKIKDGHMLANASYSMLVGTELRAIDPPTLTSDVQAPDLIYGQRKVIPVMDVNAYKQMDVKEASQPFYSMLNSIHQLNTSFAQGGAQQIVPSIQPKAAREVMQVEQMKREALGNTLVLYFNMVYQEMMLLLKTMLQFYATGNYSGRESDIVRTLTVPNFPLMRGGVGTMKVRIKGKKVENGLRLHFEAIAESLQNGKQTEIIEVDQATLRNIEFFIEDIKLEPERQTDLERSMFFEQVLQPMLNFFVPAGVADMGKVFLRYLEKFGEHPSDYISEQMLPQIMSQWGAKYDLSFLKNPRAQGGRGAEAQTGAPTTDAMSQIMSGMARGGESEGGLGRFAGVNTDSQA